jgi:hypothetical protein
MGLAEMKLAGNFSPFSAMDLFRLVKADLNNIERGSLLFIHMLLPHFPYTYDSNCLMRLNAREWPDTWARIPNSHLDPIVWGKLHYINYLDQVLCTNKIIGEVLDLIETQEIFSDATIILHGDHGSRIPRDEEDGGQVVDGHSTLFAYRTSDSTTRYDFRQIAIDELFTKLIITGGIPEGIDWMLEDPFYYNSSTSMNKERMPDFGDQQ